MTRPHRSGQGWNDRWFEGTRRGAVRGGYAATLSGAQRLSAERRRRDIFPAPPPGRFGISGIDGTSWTTLVRACGSIRNGRTC